MNNNYSALEQVDMNRSLKRVYCYKWRGTFIITTTVQLNQLIWIVL